MSYTFSNTAYCVEYFYAKPGCQAQLIKSLLKLVEPSRAEVGCLQYDLLQDNDNPNLIILLVKFTSKETMTQHENQPVVKKFSENEFKQYCENLVWNDAKEIMKIHKM